MYRLIVLFVLGLLSFSTINHAADPAEDSVQQPSLASPEYLFLLLDKSELDFADYVSISMVSKKVRGCAQAIFVKMYPLGLPFNSDQAPGYVSQFTKIQTFAPQWVYTGPLHITATDDTVLTPICSTLQKLPCISSQNLAIDLTGSYNLSIEKLKDVIESQPAIQILKIEDINDIYRLQSAECAKALGECIGQASHLDSCIILSIPVDANWMNGMAKSSSITKLHINQLNLENVAIALPRNLTTLTLKGSRLNQQLLQSVCGMPKLSSCVICSRNNLGLKCCDVSDCIIQILDKNLAELFIDGLFTIDSDAIKRVARAEAPQTTLRIIKQIQNDYRMILYLGRERPEEDKFFFLLPKTQIDVAALVVKLKLSQEKSLHVQFHGSRSFFSDCLSIKETETGNGHLTIEATKMNDELSMFLAKFDDASKLTVVLTDAD